MSAAPTAPSLPPPLRAALRRVPALAEGPVPARRVGPAPPRAPNQQLALPLDGLLPPGRGTTPLAAAAPTRPQEVWHGLTPQAQARLRQRVVQVLQEVLTEACHDG